MVEQIGLSEVAISLRQVVERHTRPSLGQEYYYCSLPLCVVDAVFSIGVRYAGVQNVVRHFARRNDWSLYGRSNFHAGEKSVHDLLRILGDRESLELAESEFDNRQRTSSKSGILKADAVRQFAAALAQTGIVDFPSVGDAGRQAKAFALIKRIPGQRSGVSWGYFLMLAGDDSRVKCDRMIQRFVEEAGVRGLAGSDAALLVANAAKVLSAEFEWLTPRLADYLVWNWQRQRATSR